MIMRVQFMRCPEALYQPSLPVWQQRSLAVRRARPGSGSDSLDSTVLPHCPPPGEKHTNDRHPKMESHSERYRSEKREKKKIEE